VTAAGAELTLCRSVGADQRRAAVNDRRASNEVEMPERHGDQVVETTTEARAGRTGQNVRWVLMIGTVAVVIIFALLWFYYFT
jgi:hypothetical protein